MEQIILNSLISAGIYSLIAFSFTVIYSTIRFFHLAHGAVYTVGAYAAYSIVYMSMISGSFVGETKAVPMMIYIFAILVSAIVAAFLGGAIDRLVYKPLRKKKASNLILLLTSFGVFIFIQNLIALLYGNQNLTLKTGPVKEGIHFLGAIITPIQILIISLAFFLFLFLFFITGYTKMGKAMRAVSDDPVTSSISGIDPEKIILFSSILGSALAGLSGAIISLETNLDPYMGFNMLLKGIIAVIIGGIGRFSGALLGCLFLGFTENLAAWFMPVRWKDAIVFGVFLLFLLFRPQGILGKKES
jgi:branched-chain amino acid transport system permease protein